MSEKQTIRIEALNKGEYLECALGREIYLSLLKEEMEKNMPDFNYDDIELFTTIGDQLVINIYNKQLGKSDAFKIINVNPLLN
jgi:hypothetical protein